MSPDFISVSGTTFQNAEAEMAWTIGGIITATFSDAENFLTHGFHQTQLIVSKIPDVNEIAFNINVFPNPVINILNIAIENTQRHSFNYSLFDIRGRKIMTRLMTGNLEQISVNHLKPGIYLLKVFDEKSSAVSVFKLHKL